MLKLLSSMSPDLLWSNIGKQVIVNEKIDAPYYKIQLGGENGISIFKSNGKKVDIVDWTLNSMYKNIMQYAREVNSRLHGDDEYTIGVFYFPVEKPRTILYKGYTDRFMVSDIFVYNKESGEKTKVTNCYEFMQNIGVDSIKLPEPINCELTEDMASHIIKYLAGIYNETMLCQKLFPKSTKPQEILNAEGYIFRFNTGIYKLQINDRNILTDKVERKMSRDIVIKDFIRWYDTTNGLSYSGKTYINAISGMFVSYMKSTDVAARYDLHAEDLTPPNIGYTPEMDTEFISSEETLKLISSSKVSENIFKILLSALHTGVSKKSDDILTTSDVERFNKISETLKVETK